MNLINQSKISNKFYSTLHLLLICCIIIFTLLISAFEIIILVKYNHNSQSTPLWIKKFGLTNSFDSYAQNKRYNGVIPHRAFSSMDVSGVIEELIDNKITIQNEMPPLSIQTLKVNQKESSKRINEDIIENKDILTEQIKQNLDNFKLNKQQISSHKTNAEPLSIFMKHEKMILLTRPPVISKQLRSKLNLLNNNIDSNIDKIIQNYSLDIRKIRILFISDTHNNEIPPTNFFPEADICIHTGDFTSNGTIDQIVTFRNHFSKLECKIGRFLLSGNNDFYFDKGYMWESHELQSILGPSIKYLRDKVVHLKVGDETIVMYGTPWVMDNFEQLYTDYKSMNRSTSNLFSLNDRFFFLSNKRRLKKWKMIPRNTNILLTHSPPYGILDIDERGRHRGCSYLREELEDLKKLDLHLFGHIHGAHGSIEWKGITHVNGVYKYSQIGYFFEYWIPSSLNF